VNLVDGDRVSGARSGTLTIDNPDSTDLGTYVVFIYNTCGGASSAAASVQFVSSGPVLELTFSAGRWMMKWSAPGAVLESAPLVTGAWSEVSGASSPFPLLTNQPTRFYRLRQP
jgi:hypothetical protein